ncbi:MAG: hypothetical protein ACRDGE_08600 [Candidatus Limnocylindria bacterium]
MSARRTTLALVVAALLAAAPAGAQLARDEQAPPTELWEESPLDPARGQESEEVVDAPVPTRTETFTRAEIRNVREGSVAQSTPEQADGSQWILLLVLALFAVGVLGVAARVFQAWNARRGERRLPPALLQELRSETGSMVPHAGRARRATPKTQPPRHRTKTRPRPSPDSARPAAESAPALPAAESAPAPSDVKHEPVALAAEPKPAQPTSSKKPVARSDAPPPKKGVPGRSPPPSKKRQVASGLPPGKSVQPRLGGAPPTRPPAWPKPSQPARPSDTPALPQLRQARTTEHRWEECAIRLWHGYTSSDFYALAVRPDGEAYVLGRSRPFRRRSSQPPALEGKAAAVHAELVAHLRAEGWEPAGRGDAWYEARLRRRLGPTLRELAGRAD